MEKTVLILVLMEWRWNKNKKTMKKNSIFCLNPCSNGMALEQSYILMICGCVLSPDFLHSPYFQLLNMYFRHFFANASIFQQQIVLFCVIIFLQHIDYQYFHSFKKFANATFINASSYLLRKTATISLGFTGAKILIFRKCHNFFSIYMLLRKIFA